MDWPNAQTIRKALQCRRPGCPCCRKGGNVHCATHDDATPSLKVNERDGGVVVECTAGCSQDDVLAAVNAWADLSFPKIMEVLWLYGLWPIERRDGEFVFRNPHNGSRFVISDDVDTLITHTTLQEMLDHVGMSEGQFWQLYDDTP